MKNPGAALLGCAIGLITLVACAGGSLTMRPSVLKNEVTPAVKLQAEDALRLFGKEIAPKPPEDDKTAFALLKNFLEKNPYIYGAAYAFVPVNKDGKLIKSSPYVYRSGGELIEKNLANAYDYTVQRWYVLPVKAGKPVWSKPYFDEGGGNAWMITYSVPIYSGENPARLAGVLTSDLLISGNAAAKAAHGDK